METNLTNDRNDVSAPLPEPLVLTNAETTQIGAGLAAAVSSVGIRCCLTCGIGALGPYVDKLS
jgi:hypothetical protein